LEDFIFDLNAILVDNFGVHPSMTLIIIVTTLTLTLGFIAGILATMSAVKLIAGEKKPVVVEVKHVEAPKEVKIDVGEFGKIVSETHVLVKGVKLEYFILKKSKYEKTTIPIGTIVVIIKRNANEAFVKPAEPTDVKRLKGVI
jgi:hypothetical protein